MSTSRRLSSIPTVLRELAHGTNAIGLRQDIIPILIAAAELIEKQKQEITHLRNELCGTEPEERDDVKV
jgi:hypothetical protein